MNFFNLIPFYLIILGLPLILTIVIELLVLFILGFRDKKLYLTVTLINIITNPSLNIILFQTHSLLESLGYLYVIFLEILVVLCEYLMLKFTFKDSKIPFLKLSFVLNSSSFLLGIWLIMLLT